MKQGASRVRRFAAACLAAGLLIPPALAHAGGQGIEGYESALIKHFSDGDYSRLISVLDEMFAQYPVHPVSVLHYSTLFQLAEPLGVPQVEKSAAKLREAIVRSGDRNSGSCLLKLDCGLEKLQYLTDSRKAKQVTDRLMPVRVWRLWGPVRKYGPADIEQAFSPEIVAGGDDSSWKRITVTDRDGWLDPEKYVYPASGLLYAAVSFSSRDPVKIRIYSRSVYRLFINGREAARNMPGSRRAVRCVRIGRAAGVTVMLKMIGQPLEKARMLVTDELDAGVSPLILPGQVFTDECDASEEHDFPYAQLLDDAGGSAAGSMRLGLYFDELESEEAIPWYRKSTAGSKTDFVSYLLAAALAARDGYDRGSAGYGEAWRIINGIAQSNPSFVPSVLKHLEYLIQNGDFLEAYRKAVRLVAEAPRYPYAGTALMRLLNSLGYEAEFEEYASLLKKRFPGCLPIMEEEVEYYKKRDRGRFMDLSRDIIKQKFTVERIRSLIKEYSSRGEYRQALDLAAEHDFNNDFTLDIVDLHIKNKDIPAARERIFRAILTRNNPYLYYALGVIDIMQSDDPSMYFQKMLAIDPSSFSISDFIQYINSGVLGNPFKPYMDVPAGFDASWIKNGDQRYPSSVLYRGRIFILQNDGSSRVYCEDIIHVSDDRGVRRWGDVRIPYRGAFHPVHLKVYDENGRASDSYSIQKVGGDVYVNISSLKKHSVIHLSYIVDNPLATPRGSALFSLPLELLQQYDEPVGTASIRVVAPAGVKVNFFLKGSENVVESRAGDTRHYAVTIRGIPAVREELFSGGGENDLYYFSFTSMQGFGDFAAWYNGLLAERHRPLESVPGGLRKESLEDTIAAVHDYVQREIELQRNVLYYPDFPENTLFRKKGTPEDKTLLARAMLERLGITSYIAFARNRFLPAAGATVFHDCFTNILLCVPLDMDNAIWLDFSGRYLPCGATAGSVSGADALVLVGDSYRLAKVRSRDPRSIVGTYDIVLSEDGSADCAISVSFSGSSGGIRSRFDDPLRLEESVHQYFAGLVNGFCIDEFKIENLNDNGRPFIIGARGTGAGVSVPGSRQLILQPVLNKSDVYEYIRYPRRLLPLVIAHSVSEQESYRYTLPASYEKDEIRNTRECSSRFGSGRVVMIKKAGSASLEVDKSVTVHPAVISPAEYGDFLKFCMELQQIEHETVKLNK